MCCQVRVGKEPVHEHDAADAERILEVLVRAGAETVD
jgi:hypothetical protein